MKLKKIFWVKEDIRADEYYIVYLIDRVFVKPNVMQANCCMVVLDPKGETLRDKE